MRSWRRRRVSWRSAFFSIPTLLRLPAHGAAILAWLQPDALARVANALPLVGIRLPDGPDARGDLADKFLVDPGDADAVRRRAPAPRRPSRRPAPRRYLDAPPG